MKRMNEGYAWLKIENQSGELTNKNEKIKPPAVESIDMHGKWEKLFQQEPIEHKGKPYRCICYGLDVRAGMIIDLELSVTLTGRVLAKSSYKNKFKKTYENYAEFLKEWEEVESWE